MAVRLPFEILPTSHLLSAPYPEREAQNVKSTGTIVTNESATTTQPLQTTLYEEQGKKVLALIYARGGSIEKRNNQTTSNGQNQKHQTSYYVSNRERTKAPTSLDFIDKMNSYLHIEAKGLVKHIDLELLLENDITLEDLIRHCQIGITDLKAAGIVNNVKDLRKLGFKMSDLVINRELFRAQQLRDLFKLTYPKLHKMKGVEFGTYDLLKCEFYPNELQALDFSFDALIQDNCLSASQLESLNYSLADLISLDLTKENLADLGITRRQALDIFKWDRQEYADFTGEPAFHRKKTMIKVNK